MNIESKEIIQINATIITGLLILISFSSIPELTKIGTPGITSNPKTYAGMAILFFSISTSIEIFKILTSAKMPQSRFRLVAVYMSSLWCMLIGFIVLAIFGYFLYVGVRISSGA